MLRSLSLLLVVGCLFVVGCQSSRRSESDAGPVDAVVSDAPPGRDAGDPSACTVEPVRSISEQCCEAFGVDACGAGLFCAAFDGRMFGTCYALGSRLPGDECFDGTHCGSGTCGPAHHCAALPGQACTLDDGCASAGGSRYLCVGGTCRSSSGDEGDPCNEAADCATGNVCVASTCRAGDVGDPCTGDADCDSGICYSGQCSSGVTDSGCMTDGDCSAGFECIASLFGGSCQPATPSSCGEDRDCPRGGCYAGACVEADLGDMCDSQPECVDSPIFGELRCIEGRCSSPRMSGEPCTDGIECESGFCYPAPDHECA